jgi:GntR family transcriptional regulator, arabinose operon transcriptional repressor
MHQLKKDKIYNKLKQNIISSKLTAGEKLPRETDFAKSLKIGRITLRAALDRLEHEGYVKRVHGKGTFVSPETIKSFKAPAIMVVRGADGGFEAPHNYIIPEVIRLAENKSCVTLPTTDTALLMFSSEDIKNYVKENNVIGIIAVMNGFRGDEPIIDEFRYADIPVVITHCGPNDTEVTGFSGIAINEKEGWKAAVDYLVNECGHKNIGMLGYGNHKFRGFSKDECIKLLEEHDAEVVESWIKIVEFDRDCVKNTVKEMFNNDKKPSAILCYSDFSAIYVYEALNEMGLKIPEDVAVMGTCGYPDAKLLTPPLSTVDYGYAEFANMAVEMLQEPEKWFSEEKNKLREKSFKIRKRKSTKIKK